MRPDVGDGASDESQNQDVEEYTAKSYEIINVGMVFSSVSQQGFAGWMDDASIQGLKGYSLEHHVPNLVWECPKSQAYTKDYDESFFIDCTSEFCHSFDSTSQYDKVLRGYISNAVNNLKYYIQQKHEEGATGLLKLDIITFHPCEKLMFGLSNIFSHSLPEQDVYAEFVSTIQSQPDYQNILNWFKQYGWEVQVEYCCIFESYVVAGIDRGAEERSKDLKWLMDNFPNDSNIDSGLYKQEWAGRELWLKDKCRRVVYTQGKGSSEEELAAGWVGKGQPPEGYNNAHYQVYFAGKWRDKDDIERLATKGFNSDELTKDIEAKEQTLKVELDILIPQLEEIDSAIFQIEVKQDPNSRENKIFKARRESEREALKKNNYELRNASPEELDDYIESHHLHEQINQTLYKGRYLTIDDLESRKENIRLYLNQKREELAETKKLKEKVLKQEKYDNDLSCQIFSVMYTATKWLITLGSFVFPPLAVADVFLIVFNWYADSISGKAAGSKWDAFGIACDIFSLVPFVGGAAKLTKLSKEAAEASKNIERFNTILSRGEDLVESGERIANNIAKEEGRLATAASHLDEVKNAGEALAKAENGVRDAEEAAKEAKKALDQLQQAVELSKYKNNMIVSVGSGPKKMTPVDPNDPLGCMSSIFSKTKKAGGTSQEMVRVEMLTPGGKKIRKQMPKDEVEKLISKQSGVKNVKNAEEGITTASAHHMEAMNNYSNAIAYQKSVNNLKQLNAESLANDAAKSSFLKNEMVEAEGLVKGLEQSTAETNAILQEMEATIQSTTFAMSDWKSALGNLFLPGYSSIQTARGEADLWYKIASIGVDGYTHGMAIKSATEDISTFIDFMEGRLGFAGYYKIASPDAFINAGGINGDFSSPGDVEAASSEEKLEMGITALQMNAADENPEFDPSNNTGKPVEYDGGEFDNLLNEGSHDNISDSDYNELYDPFTDEELLELEQEAAIDKALAAANGDERAEWEADRTLEDIEQIRQARNDYDKAESDRQTAEKRREMGEANWAQAWDTSEEARVELERQQDIVDNNQDRIYHVNQVQNMAGQASVSGGWSPYNPNHPLNQELAGMGYSPGQFQNLTQVHKELDKRKKQLESDLHNAQEGGLEDAQAAYDFANGMQNGFYEDMYAVEQNEYDQNIALGKEDVATSNIRRRQKDNSNK